MPPPQTALREGMSGATAGLRVHQRRSPNETANFTVKQQSSGSGLPGVPIGSRRALIDPLRRLAVAGSGAAMLLAGCATPPPGSPSTAQTTTVMPAASTSTATAAPPPAAAAPFAPPASTLSSASSPDAAASPAASAAWSGRLALRVEGDASQSFSALFELRGNADSGDLVLTSPIGSTLARLVWSPGQALLKSGNDTRSYESVAALAQAATGAAIPLEALFAWLAGQEQAVPGWQADLSGISSGRLRAQRDSPTPRAELRVVFERL